MKPTLEDLSTFDWIYAKQVPFNKAKHEATIEIDRINHTAKQIQGITIHLPIKKYD